MVIPQKLKDKYKLKYRFTRLDKYFSTYTKGDRKYNISGEWLPTSYRLQWNLNKIRGTDHLQLK